MVRKRNNRDTVSALVKLRLPRTCHLENCFPRWLGTLHTRPESGRRRACGDLLQGKDKKRAASWGLARTFSPLDSEVKRLRQLEEENGKLKRLVADLSLDKAMLQDVLQKKL